MLKQIPENADMRQLRTQAKELLQSIKSRHATYEGVAPETAKLSDAQRLIAHEYGFPSWPALVNKVELPQLLEKFGELVYAGKAEELDSLLSKSKLLRKHIEEPIFPFDSPALVRAANHPEAQRLIPVLVKHGANPNTPTSWWAGGFTPLSQATKPAADLLVKLGAKYDTYSAAKQGEAEILKSLLAQDPDSVNMAGGDGQRPLHVAKSADIAEILCEARADLEQRDVDHESTPIQYQINNHEVVRGLLRHGAKPDIYTAIALDDLELLNQILAENPDARNSKIGEGAYKTVSNGAHIYAYEVGGGKSPLHYAAERQAARLVERLLDGAPAFEQFLAAVWGGEADRSAELLNAHPEIGQKLTPHNLVEAAEKGNIDGVRVLLAAGVDPTFLTHSGTALHAACWHGQLATAEILADVTPLELRDRQFGATPLSWACHGANWCRDPKGDYPALVRVLLKKGARADVPANNEGATMMEIAGNREDIKAVLESHN